MFLNHVIFHLNSIAQFPSIVGATLLALARVGYWEEFLLERPCSRRGGRGAEWSGDLTPLHS